MFHVVQAGNEFLILYVFGLQVCNTLSHCIIFNYYQIWSENTYNKNQELGGSIFSYFHLRGTRPKRNEEWKTFKDTNKINHNTESCLLTMVIKALFSNKDL